MLKLISEAVSLGRGVAEQEDLQQIMQLFTYTFLAIYSVLLVTDGYYFLVCLILGFALGALFFSNTESRIVIREYQKSYVETVVLSCLFSLFIVYSCRL